MRMVKTLAATASLLIAMLSSYPVQAGNICPMDAKRCPDGSYVSRGPNCAFRACPTYTPNPPPARRPPPYRPPIRPPRYTPPPHFRPYPPRPPVRGCTRDLRVCPGGGTVARNPLRQCNFNPCPRPPYRPNSRGR